MTCEVHEAGMETLALDDKEMGEQVMEAMDVGRRFACTNTNPVVSRGVRRQWKG